jgi:hypothetical protein
MNKKSPYAGKSIILTTMHAKSIAVEHSFLNFLGAEVVECKMDTDKLGTFSGEIQRNGTALDCARIKCELGMNLTDAQYGLSSEGSFGPHPYIPFLSCDYEILYFIDRERDFHFHVSIFSEKTNYNMQSVDSIEELLKFAEKVFFSSHALILRPDHKENKNYIVKGINTIDILHQAFADTMKYSTTGKVWVETDMRAHMNPSRMNVIQELAGNLAKRLLIACATCQTPGWGSIGVKKGLECNWCGDETELIKSEIYGCVKCDYKEYLPPSHGLVKADPQHCSYCNP